ncbi:MAG: tRNA 2-thiouridine(34) synthase MnmA [Zetaproteobacteria bacterium]|nr:tRNA 2-thiouridine(34) synthase MnmA [Pseudobdellovibrionaceae bacterium]
MKIAALVSGGVDSSVALRRLVDDGHEVTAFYLKIWLEEEFAFLGECPWEEDLSFARQVCDAVGVELKVISLQKAYWDRVVSHTVQELKAGRTPSPDILCNQRVKFGAFVDHIDDSFAKIATGHYARVCEKDGLYWLEKGIDPIKDQTYFLSHLSQKQLSRCLFPIGDFPKAEVRDMAELYNLPNKARKDSQGICFLGKIKYSDFVRCHLGEKIGDIIDEDTDKTIGQHKGYWFHTIGQRKGLGLGGGPWFVVRKEVENNRIYVSRRLKESPNISRFTVSPIHWLAEGRMDDLTVKIRHGEATLPCEISEKDGYPLVQMEEGDAGVAPGQYAVFYQGQTCLGGATIHAPVYDPR